MLPWNRGVARAQEFIFGSCEGLWRAGRGGVRTSYQVRFSAVGFIKLFLGLQNYKEAVASDFEPSLEDLEKAKKECVAFELDEITFSDVDEFYLEEDEFSKLVDIEI